MPKHRSTSAHHKQPVRMKMPTKPRPEDDDDDDDVGRRPSSSSPSAPDHPPPSPTPSPSPSGGAVGPAPPKPEEPKPAEERVYSPAESQALLQAGHRMKRKDDPPTKWVSMSRVNNQLCFCMPANNEMLTEVIKDGLVLLEG